MNVLLISLGVHLLAGFILGSWVIVQYVIPDEAQFEEPPSIQEEAPPPDVKVEIKPQAKPRNQALQNLQIKQVGNIAVADVDVNLPNLEQSFTVSGGLGNFSGGGSILSGASGSIGLGISNVSVFGLKTRAERILFVVDTSRSMVVDAKGGLNSFQVIKDEITDMVGNLSAGTLFNVMLIDRKKSKLFKKQLVPAGTEVHQELVKWIKPVNSDANKPGLESDRNAKNTKITALQNSEVAKNINFSGSSGNETALITQASLEQNVDAIFLITGTHRGFEQIRRRLTEREQKSWDRTRNDKKYQEQLAAHQKEVPQMQKRIEAKLAEINKERRANGQPARVLNQRWGVYSNSSELGLKWKVPHPGFNPVYHISERDVERHFRELVQVLYEDKGAKKPSFNVILLLAGDEEFQRQWERSLNNFVRFFGGKNRIVRGLNEIKSARSAGKVRNQR